MDKHPPVTTLTTDTGRVVARTISRTSPLSQNHPRRQRHQKLCFQHTHDLSELSDVFLDVDVDGVRYSIDLRTFRFPREHQGRTWVMQLEEYANGVLSRFRDYCNRLIEDDILPSDTSSFAEVDLFTCPLCRSSLKICQECNTIVACSNQACEGSQYIEQCADHDCSICYKCLDSAKSPDEFHFVRCPSCNSWSCDEASLWCPGYIVHPELSTEELVKQSRNRQLSKESVVRSHPRTRGPCRSCIDSGHANAWQTCSCPECIPENKGRRCVCGAVWICHGDACLVDYSVGPRAGYPKLISCPRCGTDYCMEGCRYCHFCWVCQRTSICWLSNLGGGYQGRGHVWQDFAAFQHCRKMPGMSRVHVQRMLLGRKRWDKAVSELPGLDLSDVCQQHAECRVHACMG
ncbi:hypothetical protein V8E55_008627, partial [Tylopilus felleus]